MGLKICFVSGFRIEIVSIQEDVIYLGKWGLLKW